MQYSKNTSILKYGLIIVFLFLLCSLIFYMQFSLDEPVFLKHYYDRVIYDNYYMDIHLITNSNDNRRIADIQFPQMPEDFAYVMLNNFNGSYDRGYYQSEKHAHYSYNILSLVFHISHEDDSYGSIALDKAIVTYDNGDKQEANIGKIILYKNEKQTEALTSISSQSSSDNKHASEMVSNDNFIIEGITSDSDEETRDILKLKMNGTDVNDIDYPVEVAAEDSLYFETRFEFGPHDSRKFNVYDIQKKISLIDSKGRTEIMRILNLRYNPWGAFSAEKDIIQYLRETGVK